MEDYTYHYEKGNEYSLGAHMLEVSPSIAEDKPRIEVHPLGIGGKDAPARLVFEGHAGKAIVVSLVDMGGRSSPDCSGHRMRQTDHGHAELARSPCHVESPAKSARRYPPVDNSRRRTSYGTNL